MLWPYFAEPGDRVHANQSFMQYKQLAVLKMG
jgi:hypothetical protein